MDKEEEKNPLHTKIQYLINCPILKWINRRKNFSLHTNMI